MQQRRERLVWVLVILAAAVCGLSAPAQTNLAILHSFKNSITDGSLPEGQPVLLGSSLYGMSYNGGSSSNGSVFQVSTNGSAFNLLYSFSGSTNGIDPCGSLVFDGSLFYGMTYNGGTNNGGVLFQMNTDGSSYTVLHVFRGGQTDGRFPNGSPTISGSAIYGMTGNGGTNDAGVVFGMNAGSTNITVLHSFAGGISDGDFPNEGVVLGGSTLYGTTFYGGTNDAGVAFAVDANGSNFKILHHFMGGTGDGAGPVGPLTLSGSAVYGVSVFGGTNDSGVLFKVNTNGTSYTVLHHFSGGTNDGAYPQYGGLVVTNTLIYGATAYGGATNRGVVFQTSTSGTGFTVLHSFLGGTNDGANPFYSPILSGSMLYGIADGGGTNNLGVVYALQSGLPSSYCTNVPGNASQGVTITNVVAGQAYSYQASGLITYSGPCQTDPDGNVVGVECNPPPASCGGLKPGSLVGKISGTCMQLGSSGILVPPVSGPLTLYYNDSGFAGNTGSFTVCITPTNLQTVCSNVPGIASNGVSFGTIYAGVTYAFTATGLSSYDPFRSLIDPNGLPDGVFYTNPPSPYLICPGLFPLSLVGKVNGTCIQLGASGTFLTPSTGELRLYMNDGTNGIPNGFANNGGQWNVCIAPLGGEFRITAINLFTNDVTITWLTTGGQTNAVQVTPGDGQGNYQTNTFADLSGLMIIPGNGAATTSYTELGAATNFPARYYRIRIVP